MADSEQVARIRAYLEQHRHTYDREALRQRLLADGHASEDIDLAMAQVYGLPIESQAVPAGKQSPSSDSAQSALTGFFTSMLNVSLLCIALAIAVNRSVEDTALIAFAFGIGLLLPLVIEGVIALSLRQRDPALSRGLMWGVIGTVVIILLAVLLIGTCIAILPR